MCFVVLGALSPLLVIVIAVLYYLMTSSNMDKNIILIYIISVILLGVILNHLEKKIMSHIYKGSTDDIWYRPHPPKGGCGILPGHFKLSKDNKKIWGFPSEHAQFFGFTAMFFTFLMSKVLLWIITFLVCYSRIYTGCHNLAQVSTGLITGSILGLGIVLVTNKVNS